MNNWIPKAISIPNGLFHLNLSGDEKWGCIFVSEKCGEILDCSPINFLEKLQAVSILSLAEMPEKTVGMLLEKMKRTRESCSFVGVIEEQNNKVKYLRGTLGASPSADGRLRVYGHIIDLTEMKEMQEELASK